MDDYSFPKEEYLARIKHSGKISKTITSVASIQNAQLMTIPFENFDICLKKKIHLEPDCIIEKLLRYKRGGYCFELNALLLRALKSFGFSVRPLLARVHLSGNPTGRGHQISLVELDGEQWLVDAGFGALTPVQPIPLIYEQIIVSNNQTYRLIEDEFFTYMLQSKHEDEWSDLYSFDLSYVFAGDIEYGNHFTSSHNSSRFVNSRVASLKLENGLVTLLNHTLKRRQGNDEEVIALEDNESYLEELAVHFGIKLDANYSDLKPILTGAA
jgi:N-hydroxyarylamine O-acetyltransferase